MIPSKIEKFFSSYPARMYSKGDVIIQAGATPSVHYIAEGVVSQYDISSSGNKLILNMYKAGTFISLASILNDIPSAFFFEAVDQVTVHEAPRDDVTAWLKDNPDIVYDALSRISRGGDGLMLRLAHAMEGSADSRVLGELSMLMVRFPSRDGSVSISDGELAAQTGLARETVNRTLKRLAQNGYISVDHGKVKLLNPEHHI